MRKLLQNRTVVGSLCAIALLSVAGNFVPLSARRFIQASARPASAPTAADEAELPGVHAPPQICAELTGWRDLFPGSVTRRDPFTQPWTARSTPASATAPSAPHFALQAVSIQPGGAFAVVNQTVVTRGEHVGDYVVERIAPNEVWLKGPAGQVRLSLLGPDPARNIAP